MSNDKNSSQADNDNHANQLNPDHEEYWNSRGEDPPDDREEKQNSDDCF